MDREESTMDKKNSVPLLYVLAVSALLIIAIGLLFSIFKYVKTGPKVNTITTGTISVTYTEGDGVIINNAGPTSDYVGEAYTGDKVFRFDIAAKASGSKKIELDYAIKLVPMPGNTLDEKHVKVQVKSGTSSTNVNKEIYATSTVRELESKNRYLLYSGTITTGEALYYELRMWLSDQYDVAATKDSKTFSARVDVSGAMRSSKTKK